TREMNNTTCSVNGTAPYQYIFTAVYTGVMVIGLPFNGISLWIFLRRHGMRSPPAVFMTNLATADLLFVLSLPLRIYYYATSKWPFGKVMCTISEMLFRSNIFSSTFFITLISVDRFLAVVYPLRSRAIRTVRKAGTTCLAVWVFTMILTAIWAKKHYESPANNCGCFESHSAQNKTNISPMPLVLAIFVFLLLICNGFCTVMVLKNLHKTLTGQLLAEKKKLMWMFFLNVFMFAVFFAPFSIVLFLAFYQGTVSRLTLRFVTCFTSINFCLDPVIYYFSLESFWEKKESVEMDTTRTQDDM
uniref:G-protein coupled receptors family 1 profile domain-containing protein n=1 Tax=Lepisosteus oculatus TaxID=7918 RepID=W5NLI7_LEPOC